MTKRYFWFTVGAIVILIGILFIAKAFEPNDPAEEKQVVQAIEDVWFAFQIAGKYNDISLFDHVFVDTRDYKPPKETKEKISSVFGEEVAENAGFLTTMKLTHIELGRGKTLITEKLQKAKEENRELNQQEIQEIIDQTYAPTPDSNKEIKTTKLIFDSIEINGDKAIVIFRTPYSKDKATVVKINGKWLVSSIEVLHAGF